MADIELYNAELDAVCVVKTEAQAEILKESGWSKKAKPQERPDRFGSRRPEESER